MILLATDLGNQYLGYSLFPFVKSVHENERFSQVIRFQLILKLKGGGEVFPQTEDDVRWLLSEIDNYNSLRHEHHHLFPV
jgi:hypothetical protein